MKIQTPQLPVQLDELAAPQLHDDELFEDQRIISLDAIGVRATNVSFDECELVKPLFSQATLEKLQLRDVRIIGGDCTATNASDGGSLRVTFDDVRMTGFDASRSTYKEVSFRNCKIDMANFRFAKLKNVRFEDCNLTDCDFQSSQLTNVVFRNCTLQKVLLSNATCKQVDMRSSQIDNLVGWQSASGVIIDSVQLMHVSPELAQELKITVSDE